MQAESSRTRLDSRLFVNQHISVLHVLKRSRERLPMIYTIKCLCVDTYEHIFVRAQ